VNRLLTMTVVVLLAACAKPVDEAQPKATLVKQPTVGERNLQVRAELPVKVRLDELSRSGTAAVVRATVDRRIGIDLPYSVTFALPAGVTARRGRTAFTLAPNTEAVVVSEEYELTWDVLPTADALLEVHGTTGTMGMHFKMPYRFGRPEVVEPAPAAVGPRLKMGDRDFGPSIPLK
jgi:hypothetical protein